MYLRLRFTTLVTALLASTAVGLLAQSDYRLAAEVPLQGSKIVDVLSAGYNEFAIGLQHSAVRSEVRKLDREGKNRWSRELPGKLAAVRSGGRALFAITSEGSEESPGMKGYVLDRDTGSIERTFTALSDQVVTLSAAGDAVATYSNPYESPSNVVRIQRVVGGDTKTIRTDGSIATVALANYDYIVVLINSGRLDVFKGTERVIARRLTRQMGSDRLQVAADASIALVELGGGGFLVFDLINRVEIYRYSPIAPERALAQLKILDEAKAAVAGPGSSRRLARLAANLRPTLLPNGDIILRSTAETEMIEVRLKPLNGFAQPLSRLKGARSALANAGRGQALEGIANRRSGSPRIFFDDVTGAGIVATPDRLLFLATSR